METYQAAFKTSPNGMIFIGEDCKITCLNPLAEKIFACSSKELEGQDFREFLENIDVDEPELLGKCNSTIPYSTCKKARTSDGKTRYLDLWMTFDPDASDENRHLIFVNDVTSQKKREGELKKAYAIETTLKKVLHICRDVTKLEDTLKYALQLTVALPDIKALPRAVVLATENNLSRLELKANIGLNHKEIETLFNCDEETFYSLENTSDNIEALCSLISPEGNSYHAIIDVNLQTVIMVLALEEKVQNSFAYENLNSIADVIADTIGHEKLKKDQADLIVNLNESMSDLDKERSFSDSVLESLNSGLLVIDDENRVTQANPAAEELLLNFYDGDFKGKSLQELFGSNAEILEQEAQGALSHKIRLTNLANEEAKLEFTISPIHTADGDSDGKVVVFADITIQHKMKVKFDKLNRFGAIAEIAAAIAQEIKNPLAGIKSMSQILDNRLPADDESKEFITRIIKQVDRLDLLLNEFFTYSRPSLPDKQTTMLNDVLINAWQMAESKSGKKGLSLHETFNAEPQTLWADPEQLQQVFVNLFLNAIEAVDDNSYVEVSTEFTDKPSEKYDLSRFKGLNDDASYLVVIISDSGCGIADDIQSKIFDPFVTNKINHSGLGLSLVWRILKEHASNIYFESQEGKGSTFTLFMKAQQDLKS